MKGSGAMIWDLPLRVWHWLLAISVCVSLYTGLSGDLDLMTVHQWSGITVAGLLIFRVLWGIWGGIYARFHWYFTTPRKIFNHFLRRPAPQPHTAPGIALVVVWFIALLVQTASGLFTTDDIFTEGPLVRYVSNTYVELGTSLHRDVWVVVLAAVCIHLLAQLIYGAMLRNPLPLSMITGRKSLAVQSTTNYWARALISLSLAGVVFISLAYLME